MLKGVRGAGELTQGLRALVLARDLTFGSYMMAHKTSVIPAAEDPILCPNLQEHHTWVYDAHTHMYV